MFVILLKYLKPISEVDKFLVPHRAYLDELYQQNVLVASGPQIPRNGGVLIASGMEKSQLESLLKKDPFAINGIAEYTIIEFEAVKNQPAIKDFA